MKVKRITSVIEAVQWFPGVKVQGVQGADPNWWCGCVIVGGPCSVPHVHTGSSGGFLVEEGDWIIPLEDGIHYTVCKPEEFEETFEEVTK